VFENNLLDQSLTSPDFTTGTESELAERVPDQPSDSSWPFFGWTAYLQGVHRFGDRFGFIAVFLHDEYEPYVVTDSDLRNMGYVVLPHTGCGALLVIGETSHELYCSPPLVKKERRRNEGENTFTSGSI